MKIRPAHHALLCYAEWCADNRRRWPGMKRVAADLARDISDLQTAFSELQRWGLLSTRHQGYGHNIVIRLGDGRETAPFPIYAIHSSRAVLTVDKSVHKSVDNFSRVSASCRKTS